MITVAKHSEIQRWGNKELIHVQRKMKVHSIFTFLGGGGGGEGEEVVKSVQGFGTISYLLLLSHLTELL